MQDRPYFRYSIIELEAVAQENWSNIAVLEYVANELVFRKKQRAKKLQQKIHQQIDILQSKTECGSNEGELYEIFFPQKWIKGVSLDRALKDVGSPYSENYKNIIFNFPVGSNLILEAGIRILCIANQLSADGKNVTFKFDDINVLNYLNLMEFFIHLDPRVNVIPYRPEYSHRGSAESLVEIGEIVQGKDIGSLPGLLTNTFCIWAKTSSDSALGLAGFTVFGEMIANVQEHSDSALSGYAALQVYRPTLPRYRHYIQIVVSDSGKGIVNTLRPVLNKWYSEYQDLSASAIIGKIFEMGLSRFGPEAGRGVGLKKSWQQAMKSDSRLVIRQDTCSVTLKHLRSTSQSNFHEDLVPIRGTHMSLEFYLDRE